MPKQVSLLYGIVSQIALLSTTGLYWNLHGYSNGNILFFFKLTLIISKIVCHLTFSSQDGNLFNL